MQGVFDFGVLYQPALFSDFEFQHIIKGL